MSINKLPRDSRITIAASEALFEAKETTLKWPEFHSVHEGYAVILEELDEVWEECRLKHPSNKNLRKEVIQVAAMAIRFAAELTKE